MTRAQPRDARHSSAPASAGRESSELAFLQTLLDAIPSPVFYKDLAGRYLGCNRAFAAFIGRTPQEVVGRTVSDLSPRDVGAFNEAKDAEALRTGTTQIYEAVIPLLDDSIRQVEIHKAVYHDGAGTPSGVVGTWLDITERKEAEETLRASEERFRRIFDESPLGMATTGADFRFLRANAAFCEMLGYSERELASLTFRDLTHPDHLSSDAQAVAALVEGRLPVYRTEKRYIRKNGEVVWGTLTLSVIRDRDGQTLHFLVMVRDISKQVAAEQALTETHRELALRSRITESFLLAPGQEMYGRVLDAVLAYTESEFGLFGYLTDDEDVIALSLTRTTARAHRARDGDVRLPRTTWELSPWGRAILERRSVSSNEPAAVPEGHPPVTCALAIPVLHQERVIGLLAVANREAGYGEADRMTMERIATHIAPMLHARLEAERHEAARRQAEEERTRSLERLRSAMTGIVQAMIMAVEARDPYTAGHQRRVARLAAAIGAEMGLPPDKVDGIRYAGMIHDIGKISVPAEILSKPMRLSAPEMGLVRTHSQSGADILSDIDFPWPIAEIVLQHHERLDGSGYPAGLEGDEILVEARSLGVADVVDAAASHRPYRPARGIDAALEELVAERGTLYDPSAVDACVRLFREKGYTLTELD